MRNLVWRWSTRNWPQQRNIDEFTYSKLRHFDLFRRLPGLPPGAGNAEPATCDLKVYQDCLMCCFLRRNVRPGSRILEVGGGDSRVLRHFQRDYECWNIDKCEGLGHGPQAVETAGYRMVYDYAGSFNRELPDDYFDFVFSISALEHTPEDAKVHADVFRDINRVLKPGAPTFHCLDIMVRPKQQHWVAGLIPYLYSTGAIENHWVEPDVILEDQEAYHMSEAAYDTNWKPILGWSYKEIGWPVSYNLYWRRP